MTSPQRKKPSGAFDVAFGKSSWTSTMVLATVGTIVFNKNLGLILGLILGALGYLLLRWIASTWDVGSSKSKTIKVNVISGAILGLVGGAQLGWGGGPEGSPSALIAGVRVPFSLLTWPILLAIACSIFGLIKGFAASSASRLEMRSRTRER